MRRLARDGAGGVDLYSACIAKALAVLSAADSILNNPALPIAAHANAEARHVVVPHEMIALSLGLRKSHDSISSQFHGCLGPTHAQNGKQMGSELMPPRAGPCHSSKTCNNENYIVHQDTCGFLRSPAEANYNSRANLC